jgi:hypothetical protein
MRGGVVADSGITATLIELRCGSGVGPEPEQTYPSSARPGLESCQETRTDPFAATVGTNIDVPDAADVVRREVRVRGDPTDGEELLALEDGDEARKKVLRGGSRRQLADESANKAEAFAFREDCELA